MRTFKLKLTSIFIIYILIMVKIIIVSGLLLNSHAKINQPKSSLEINGLGPKLNFSTYFSGSDITEGRDIAVASDGSCYICGYTFSSDIPLENSYNYTYGGNGDCFIVKLSSTGSLLWSTYLGGNKSDSGRAIILDNEGNCLVLGSTKSLDFPTKNAYNDTKTGGEDVFLAKFTAEGSLLWSTFLGGSFRDYGSGIAITEDNDIYIIGTSYSDDFPVLSGYNNTNGGNGDAFVAKFSSAGSLIWSTFLGGSEYDYGKEVCLTNSNNCVVIGGTTSNNFPTMNAYDDSFNGISDGFFAKFDSAGNLLLSSLIGGNDHDLPYDIEINSDDGWYIVGRTASSNFPIKNAFDTSLGGANEGFISRFASDGSLDWSSFFGGSDADCIQNIVVAPNDSFFISGDTYSSDFSVKNAYNSTFGGFADTFIAKFTGTKELIWSTFFGGLSIEEAKSIDIDNDKNCYITGFTSSTNFPMKNAIDTTIGIISSCFISKFTETFIANSPTNAFSTTTLLGIFLCFPIVVIILHRRKKQ